MASGQQHDRATCWLALPYGVLWWPWLGPQGAIVSAFAFLLGGLWLSPDLDTNSRPYQRWGPLRWLWWPYRKALRHRSLVSHTPLLGSAVRLVYVGGFITGLAWLLHPWGTPLPTTILLQLEQYWHQQRGLCLALLISVEASAWLHLIQDGDPVPRLPGVLKRRRRHHHRLH